MVPAPDGDGGEGAIDVWVPLEGAEEAVAPLEAAPVGDTLDGVSAPPACSGSVFVSDGAELPVPQAKAAKPASHATDNLKPLIERNPADGRIRSHMRRRPSIGAPNKPHQVVQTATARLDVERKWDAQRLAHICVIERAEFCIDHPRGCWSRMQPAGGRCSRRQQFLHPRYVRGTLLLKLLGPCVVC